MTTLPPPSPRYKVPVPPLPPSDENMALVYRLERENKKLRNKVKRLKAKILWMEYT